MIAWKTLWPPAFRHGKISYLSIFLLSVSAAMAAEEASPFQIPDKVMVQNDVMYSTVENTPMLGDLYLPKTGGGPFPAVVYVHGGGKPTKKLGGTKGSFRRQAAYLATKGFAGASCREASKALEQALGQSTSEQLTAEFHATQPAGQQVRQQS